MKKFYLKILTPEKVFYSGEAEMITVSTVDGLVSVMAMHQPTVLALQPGYIKILSDGKWKEAFISDGFAEIRPDETVVLSQAVEWPEDIDEIQALAAKERAEEMLRRRNSLNSYKLSKAALQRAFARLKVKSHNDGKYN
jgi:F-type H+-transporting ATPase subunit epsilon